MRRRVGSGRVGASGNSARVTTSSARRDPRRRPAEAGPLRDADSSSGLPPRGRRPGSRRQPGSGPPGVLPPGALPAGAFPPGGCPPSGPRPERLPRPRAAASRSISAVTTRASSSAVASQVKPAAHARARERQRAATAGSASVDRAASIVAVSGPGSSTSQPVCPSRTASRSPGTRKATAGTPWALASSTDRPQPSPWEGLTVSQAVDSSRSRSAASTYPCQCRTSSPTPRSWACCSSRSRSGPSPTISTTRPGWDARSAGSASMSRCSRLCGTSRPTQTMVGRSAGRGDAGRAGPGSGLSAPPGTMKRGPASFSTSRASSRVDGDTTATGRRPYTQRLPGVSSSCPIRATGAGK